MRLLFVHQSLGAHGGAEANIQITATELLRRGHTVGLLHGRGTGHSEDAWRKTFSQCFGLAEAGTSENIPNVLRKFQPEVIYMHKMADLDVIETLLESGAPVVRMVHDHELYCMRSYKYNYFTREICTRPTSSYCVFPCLASLARNPNKRLPVRWVGFATKKREMRLNQHCRRLVVYSQYAKQELVRNGFDPEKIEIHVPIRCWGTNGQISAFSERNLILYAGQIIRGKGVDLLLKALAKIKTPFECLILGDGNQRPYCQRLCAKLGLEDRVHFPGFIRRDELKKFYLDCSVFVVSSVWPEPFGMVGPEAMRYGLPVVAFDAGGIREWLINGENGYLVPWMDIATLAARIEELLNNKALAREMGQRGLKRVNREYDAARQVGELENMFLQVIDEVPNITNRNQMFLPEEGFCE